FRFTKKEADKFYDEDDEFWPSNLATDFDRTLQQVKTFFARSVKETYAAAIANAAEVVTYGALPGTWASLGPDRDGMMHVPKNPKEGAGDDFSGLLAFYRDYLKIPEDPEQRGYGTYDRE